MKLKDRIAMLRQEKGWTQTKMAAEVNRTEATVRAWETGRAKPTADTLIQLTQIFNCSMDFLFGFSDERRPKK